VIFDMDGVVVDSEPLSMATITEIIGERGGRVDPGLLGELTGVSLGAALGIAAERSGRLIDAADLRSAYEQRYLPRLRAAAAPTPGLPGLVTALRAAGIPLALASSSSLAEIDAVVTALRLGPALRAIASGEEVPRHKPAPDVYLLAVERLGTGPAGVLAIEDSATGVAAAVAAGLGCVAVRTPATRAHDFSAATLIVGSLEELDPAILERLASSQAVESSARAKRTEMPHTDHTY
jgi:HAD superfamily hydrolase (TIGR01509 family)